MLERRAGTPAESNMPWGLILMITGIEQDTVMAKITGLCSFLPSEPIFLFPGKLLIFDNR